MCPICRHCGQGFAPGRAACPHCGADEEAGWKEDDTDSELDLPAEMDDEAYESFLADEGLADPARRPRPRPSFLAGAILALVAASVLSGLLYLFFR